MKTTNKSFRKGRLRVVLDRNQVFPDDPGAGTPAMVYSFQYSATYWCACGEGELSGGELQLTPQEVDWLESLDAEITQFLYRA